MTPDNNSGDDSQPQAEAAEPTAFNVDNIIADITGELETKPETTAEEVPPEAAPVAEDQPTQEATPDKPEELLSPLLAEKSRREREARAEIEALKGTTKQEVEDAKAALLKELLTDPQAFIAQYGIENPGDLAMHFYAADLGDAAPDELKQQIGMNDFDRAKAEMKQELAALRAEISQREEIARNQATLSQYDGFLSDVPAELPYLQVEVQHNQQEALRTMAEVADHMFERDGRYPSASVVAQAIENEIASQAARYSAIGKPQPNVKQPQTAKPVETQTRTLSTEHSGSSAKKRPVGYDEHFEDALALFSEMYPNKA